MNPTRLSTALATALISTSCTADAVLGAVGDGTQGASSSAGASESEDTTAPTGAPPLDLPPWVPPPGSWSEVSLNTLSDVDPCEVFPCSWSGAAGQEGLVDSWNSAAFATTRGSMGSLLVWGGGGGSGYYGNELYAYDVAARTWQRQTEPVPDPQVTDADNGELQDGSPVPLQTNDLLEYHPGTDSVVVLLGSPTLAGPGHGAGHMFGFDQGWRRTALLPHVLGLGASAYDPTREIFWANSQGGNLFAYDPTPGPDADGRYGVVVPGPSLPVELYAVAAIDPDDDLYVVVDARADRLWASNLGAPQQPPVELQWEGAAPSRSGGGLEWVPERGRFYWYAGDGNDIRTLTPPADSMPWDTGLWRWDPVDVLGGPPPQPRTTPVFASWRWAPAIGSFLICNGVDQPVHAFRI
ncbi:MAG: hypothetical protein K0V04_21020 [Deltaproteobacteria bacterium]|nr:hypothetical protein [Deltaproteobacteria bacterium]